MAKCLWTTSINGLSVLSAAIYRDLDQVVLKILQQGLNWIFQVTKSSRVLGRPEGSPPLLVAVCYEKLETVRALIAAGAKINWTLSRGMGVHVPSSLWFKIPDEDGLTVLQVAAAYGYSEIIHALLDAGAEIDILTKKNSSALYFAVVNQQVEAGLTLIQHKLMETKEDELFPHVKLWIEDLCKYAPTSSKRILHGGLYFSFFGVQRGNVKVKTGLAKRGE